jgi:hypothetical protein
METRIRLQFGKARNGALAKNVHEGCTPNSANDKREMRRHELFAPTGSTQSKVHRCAIAAQTFCAQLGSPGTAV